MSLQHEDKPEFPANEHIEQAHSGLHDADLLRRSQESSEAPRMLDDLDGIVGEVERRTAKAVQKIFFDPKLGESDKINPCSEISLGDYEECVLPCHNDLTTTSLENLGRILLHKDCTTLLHFDVRAELVNRLDESLEKARGIMKYHIDTFSSNPDDTNWYALIAIMAAYQQLKLEVS